MNCLNNECENEVTRDYPVCGLHEATAHFTNRADCRCGDCQAKRAEINASELRRLEAIAFTEELQFLHGRPIAAAA